MDNPTILDALYSLRPRALWECSEYKYANLKWLDEKQTKPTESEVNAEITRLTNLHKYQEPRRAAYPKIGDQLDDLYKQGAFSADMAAKIKKVKDDNPKS